MNDDQVMTALLDSVPVLRMETTVQTILARGDRVRKLHRMPTALAAAAVAACLALAVPAMLPAGPPDRGASVSLAAWTVTREPGGLVAVTIRELRDAARLQRMLRSDGLPAPPLGLSHTCRL